MNDPWKAYGHFEDIYDEIRELLEYEYEQEDKEWKVDMDAPDVVLPYHWTTYLLPMGIFLPGFIILATITATSWKGAMRQYLIAKATAITFSIIAKILINLLLALRQQYTDLKPVNKVKETEYTYEGNFGSTIVHSLENATGLLTDAIGTIFLHELYQRTCKMKVRKDNVVGFLGQLSLALLLSVVFTGIQAIVFHLISPNSEHNINVGQVYPLNLVLSCIMTTSNVYLAFYILESFKNSQEFRIQSGSSHRKPNLLPVMVKITVVASVGKIIFEVVEISTMMIVSTSYHRCLSYLDETGNLIPKVLECIRSLQKAVVPFYSISYTWFRALEYGCLYTLKICYTETTLSNA